LVNEGLRTDLAVALTSTLSRIRLLAKYYYDHCEWSDVREHETRTFLVAPLLLALGWAEQQLKIELPVSGGKVDIACFATRYRQGSTDCQIIIETKGFSAGLTHTHRQAEAYAADFADCHKLLVTNGFCYKLFSRLPGEPFPSRPTGYMNLLKPTDRYARDPGVLGVREVLHALIPGR
jgi:hypothetical protein